MGNNVINFVHLKKYIRFGQIQWCKLDVVRHLRPAVHIFVLNLIISIYLNLNSVMLGFMQGDEAVGLYTAGNKIAHIVLSVVTSLGVVMIPRCSNLIEAGNMKEFGAVIGKATRLVMCMALPFTVGLMLLATPIIRIFCGESFVEAIPVLYWTAPIIIFIGLTNVIGLQVLYPQGRENIVIWSTLGGAVFNLILNLVLIPLYSEIGAAIATFIAELAVLILQIILGYKYFPLKIKDIKYQSYLVATIIMAVAVALVIMATGDMWMQVVLSMLLGGTLYVGYLLYVKDDITTSMLNVVLKK